MYFNNTFESLVTNEENSTNNPKRKANKKLREIEKLIKKKHHTPDEKKKIDQKDHWENFLEHTPLNYKSENAELKKKQNNRHEIKLQKKIENIENIERLNKKRACLKAEKKVRLEAEKRVRLEAEKRARLEARKRARLQEARERALLEARKYEKIYRNMMNKSGEEKNETLILIEYYKLLEKNKYNNDKTFRQISKKYHPDKNLDNSHMAHEKQKIVTYIKDKFNSS